MAHRSAITGRYVSNAAAARHPRTTVTERAGNTSRSTSHRSAITGHYVTESTARRHPNSTVTERGKSS